MGSPNGENWWRRASAPPAPRARRSWQLRRHALDVATRPMRANLEAIERHALSAQQEAVETRDRLVSSARTELIETLKRHAATLLEQKREAARIRAAGDEQMRTMVAAVHAQQRAARMAIALHRKKSPHSFCRPDRWPRRAPRHR